MSALRATNAFVESGQWDSDLDTIQSTYLYKGEFLVGVLDENVVAMGAYKYISEQIVEIKRMRVGPNLQGKGIGRHLLSLLEDSARDAGYQSVQLDTTVNQVAAQRLYVSSGYTEIRRETEDWPLETIFYQKSLYH